MFDGLKNIAGLAGMMKDLPKMQARMAEVKAHLTDLKIESKSANGAIFVIVNGRMEIEVIKIDPSILEAGDVEHLQESIQSAINEALSKARDAVQQKLASVASEMGMHLPPGGLDL